MTLAAASISASASRAPGVYVEWLDANPQHLELRRTDVAGFLGIAERGPLHAAIKIESARQFFTTFGKPIEPACLAYAVEGFFSNGGRTCWVVRVADRLHTSPARMRVVLPGASFVLRASSAGAWGDGIAIEATWDRDGVVALTATESGREQRIGREAWNGTAAGSHAVGLKTLLGVPADALPELNPSVLVEVVADDPSLPGTSFTASRPEAFMSGGSDGLASLRPDHFTGNRGATDDPWGIDALDRVDGVSFVAAPDLMLMKLDLPALRDAQITVIGHCVRRNDRLAILDLPAMERNEAIAYRAGLPDCSFGALYYPWVCIDDPLRLHGNVRIIPPSGHVAGMLARTDRIRGVHKPPANEILEGVWDLSHRLDATAHAELNDHGINAIRAVPGRGVLVLGARTLAKEVRWRYVNVRRLFAMIEEALEEQMQWLTFEPNNPRLWKEVDRAVRGFLERIYAAGMLDGATSDDGYFVHCDETTNPSSGVDEGRVVCDIGIQPPYPAEFVIVRIGVTRSGIQIEEKGAQDV